MVSWRYLILFISIMVLDCFEMKTTVMKRVSDPFDMGGPWPIDKPLDINTLTISSGKVPTVDTDIPGNPLGPSDFNRLVKEVHMSMNIGERRDPIEMAGLFQGDIMLTARDGIPDLTRLTKVSRKIGQFRNAVLQLNRRWTNGVIPYVISKTYDLNERSIIAKAIKEYHNETCIRFVPRTKEDHYIHFLKGDGCSSSVGRSGGAQAVSLGPGCLFVGVVMHELMHATGFWHEQSRADRDSYIKIVWENIQNGMEYNFKKYNWSEIQNLGVEYDPKSIMHYGPYAFAKVRQKPTIIPLSKEPIGQRDGFSIKDRTKIQKLYECDNNQEITPVVQPKPEKTEGNNCKDFSKTCPVWAASGECEKNALWMKSNCKKSCLECGKECDDTDKNCTEWAAASECTNNPSYMLIYCKRSCGICRKDNEIIQPCTDTNEHCKSWAENNQCRVNPDYMLIYCSLSCNSC